MRDIEWSERYSGGRDIVNVRYRGRGRDRVEGVIQRIRDRVRIECMER